MKRTIFVAMTIVTLGAIGVMTSIMNSGTPVYAAFISSQSGHSTTTIGVGTDTTTFSGHLKCDGCGPQGTTTNGGGKLTCIDGNLATVKGSSGFKASAQQGGVC